MSTQSWWILVFAAQPTLVCPCVGVHRRMFLMSLSLFLQHVLFLLLGLVLRWKEGSRTTVVLWRCCFQDLFNAASLPSSHLAFPFDVLIQVVQQYNHTDTATAFLFSLSIIKAVTVSLGRPYAWSICFIIFYVWKQMPLQTIGLP